MGNITLLYLTDNSLEPSLALRCQELLIKVANGKRIVSVSQKPLDFGYNVCVGDIGRNGLSIDIQMLAGLEQIKTDFVAIAEHDCMYSQEHFEFIPNDYDNFYYNNNCWLVQYSNPKFPELNGQYSFMNNRRVQSQLVCSVELLKKATAEKIEILSAPEYKGRFKDKTRLGEPGTNYLQRSKRVFHGQSFNKLWDKIKKYITLYNAKDFNTVIPNLDIRHSNNFTGPRRGKNRTFSLAPWGRFFGEVL